MKVLAIAKNTFKEAVRNRILYLLLIFAILMIGSSRILALLTISAHERVIKDIGLFGINFFGVLIAILVGIGLVYQEIDKKTIYTLVSKPIHRYQFILGKYVGLLITVYVNLIIMTLFFFFMILALKAGFHISLLYAIIYTALELAIITALAIVFSSFSNPTMSAIYTLIMFIIGRMNEDILRFAQYLARESVKMIKAGQEVPAFNKFLQGFATVICRVLPNLGLYNIRAEVIHSPDKVLISWEPFAYAFSYSIFLLLIAIFIFQRRNFK